MRHRLLATAALLLALVPRAALAQSAADRTLARDLANEGYDALDRKDYATAAQRFARADALFHVATVAIGLARAQVGLGHLVDAQDVYRRIVAEGAPPGAPGPIAKAVADARRELAALERRVANVTITVAGADGAAVTIDGTPMPAAALGLERPIDPGKHVFRATAAGHRPQETTLTLREGAHDKLTLTLQPAPVEAGTPPPASPLAPVAPVATAPPAADAPARDQPASETSPAQRIAGATLMGVGGVGAILGSAFAVIAHGKYSTLNSACPSHTGCDPSLASTLSGYHAMSNASVASFVVGGAALATGVIVFATAPKAKPAATQGVLVVPRIGLGSVAITGSF